MVNYIDCLIYSEKQEGRKDRVKRVEFFQEVRQQAVLIATATNKKSLTDSQLESFLDCESVHMLTLAEKKHKKNAWEMRLRYFERIENRLSKESAGVQLHNPVPMASEPDNI